MSPGRKSTGRRLTCATAAAVTKLLAPGPIEVVHAIMRRRAWALAKAIAACAIACSLCARNVGSLRRAACSAGPSPATLPWPKIAHTPAKSGLPSSSCAAKKLTTASAIVIRTTATWVPLLDLSYSNNMLEIAQFGAGRIGQIHASNIAASKNARLRYVIDVSADAAKKLAARYGAKVATEAEAFRSEERRVGKEWRSGRTRNQ